MLSTQANERLTRVGPGTPAGELMRRYWMPFLPAAKLLEDPVQKVRLLGEDLVCFRTLNGELGLIGDRCPHRNAGLEYGIPDEDGLRCPYHGWMMGPSGQCIDTPLEAADSTFKDKIKITGYPVQEMGGMLFAYMGPAPAPLLPPWDLFVWPNAVRQIGIAVLNANWLQCQENTGDPTHAIYLHGYLYKYVLQKMGDTARLNAFGDRFISGERGIKDLYVHSTEYGMEKGVVFSKELGADRDGKSRHSTVVFPIYTEQTAAGAPWSEFQIRVPIDDEHTYHISYGCYAAPPGVEAPRQDIVPYYELPIFDGQGKAILDCVLNQDFVGWWSQGGLTDRSKEKLGRTDIPIIFQRRQLEQQIRIVEQGGEPMNVFRDAATMPGVIFGGGKEPAAQWHEKDWWKKDQGLSRNNRLQYHRGGADWESDRYGPAIPQVAELHRRIEEFYLKQQAGTPAAT